MKKYKSIKYNRIRILLLLLVMLEVAALPACSVTGITYEQPELTITPTPRPSDGWAANILLTVNGREVDYREVLLYLLSAKEESELLYGEGIWDYTLDEEGRTYGTLRKEQVLDELLDIQIACTHAEELGVAVYEEENRDIAEFTAEFIENVGRDALLKYNITEALIKQLYTNNIIATKVYESITLSVDTDISDEEARQMKIQYIFKTKEKTLNDVEKENGVEEELTEEELSKLRTTMQTLRDTAITKEDFASYAKLNTDSSDGVEKYIGAGDLPDSVSKIVLTLKDGELSPVIETEEGFYIFKCITAFDEDATAARKEEMIVERQRERFSTTFTEWKAAAEVIIDEQQWEKLKP